MNYDFERTLEAFLKLALLKGWKYEYNEITPKENPLHQAQRRTIPPRNN